jgi:hypothetical protein
MTKLLVTELFALVTSVTLLVELTVTIMLFWPRSRVGRIGTTN